MCVVKYVTTHTAETVRDQRLKYKMRRAFAFMQRFARACYELGAGDLHDEAVNLIAHLNLAAQPTV